MKKILVLFTFAPLLALSQNDQRQNRDSLRYYNRVLMELAKKSYDSLKATASYQEAVAGIERHVKRSNNYTSFVIFGGVTHSDMHQFNQSIARSGFEPLKSTLPSFGLGISAKTNRTMIDFYFFNFTLSAKSKKADETVRFNLFNMWMFDLGYDLLKSRTMSFYPYAGLSLRSATVSFTKPPQQNPDFTDISTFILNDRSVNFSSNRAGYQAGLGFDLLLAERKTAKTFCFVKAGINRPIGGEKYKSDDLRFDPQIESGQWAIHFGFKFGGKN